MDRFVELCVCQYQAEYEKQKLIGANSDTAIDTFKSDCVGRQMMDIMRYSKGADQCEKFTNEFRQYILSKTK